MTGPPIAPLPALLPSGPSADDPAPPHFPAPWACDWGEDAGGLWQAFRYKGVRQALRWMPPGRFTMGSPDDELGHLDNERLHWVTLTRGFWLAETACTQALWQALMGDNPSSFKGEQRPVDSVSWDGAQRCIARLNEQTAAVGLDSGTPPGADRFRLPTEAEWEYACRAGTTTPFSFGEDIDPELANYDGNFPYRGDRKGKYREETVEVATLPPNPWGLYEMHGNLWEWCRDWYGEYPAGQVTDPVGPASGGRRVLRGGSWFNLGRDLRSAYRYHSLPGLRGVFIGFRLALGPELRQEGPAGE